jgi:urease accessory protein
VKLMRTLPLRYSLLMAMLLAPIAGRAHGLDAEMLERLGPFGAGLSHPVLGFDHFLAMFSVGLLSAVLGRPHVWRLPISFVLAMPIGWWLGRQAIPFPPVEFGISLSVLTLGLATWVSARWPDSLPANIVYVPVIVFALFHGYAHGVEMPAVQSANAFAAGFMAGTGAIHLLGLFVGDILAESNPVKHRVAWASLTIIGAGLYFVVSDLMTRLTHA